ncbi:trehalose 6-phosphatase [Sediminihabitans luteus]|uniref:Trehalose 6-phosphate phosphatase n=1 Tax=Sediminihabitans luteus TaxID=1138585 RepID=A0A2M9CE45_9CELL|nr:trehalose-phosphatase [Sediminihabitans luteus]PJJ70201.1 trehalose 6-phosphatase [Sediminihabitans luteus]GII97672.1 hypothetical protein Slu03_00500 [Sediminihabitans luteus]
MSGPTPPPLPDDLVAALDALAARRPLLVALDFDGVLAPLVDDPSASRPLPASATAIARLADADDVHLALVSGRDLAGLARLATPPTGTWLVGSHGAEHGEQTPDGVHAVPLDLTPDQRAQHRELVAGLERVAAGAEGAWVETKPTAAVLHTRRTPPDQAAGAVEAAVAVATGLGLDAMRGKDVVEVAVLATSKGQAVVALRERLAGERSVDVGDVGVLYAGDDTTDEHAFEVLGDGDVSVKVGDGDTVAGARVADPASVAALLAHLADAVAAPGTSA